MQKGESLVVSAEHQMTQVIFANATIWNSEIPKRRNSLMALTVANRQDKMSGDRPSL
jgi:hypothetical protein